METLLYITWNVDPVAFSIGSLSVRWFGICWAVGLYLCWLVQVWLYKQDGAPEDWADKIFTYMTLGVIIGARLGHCWFYEWHEAALLGQEPLHILGLTFNYRNPYIEHPLWLLKIWEGGLSSHGGALGLITAGIILDRKHFHTGIPWIFDRLVIGIAITATLIRFGNLMNSEIYAVRQTFPGVSSSFATARPYPVIPRKSTRCSTALWRVWCRCGCTKRPTPNSVPASSSACGC